MHSQHKKPGLIEVGRKALYVWHQKITDKVLSHNVLEMISIHNTYQSKGFL